MADKNPEMMAGESSVANGVGRADAEVSRGSGVAGHAAASEDSARRENPAKAQNPAHGGDAVVEKQLAPMEEEVPGVVITVSDRCAAGTRPDKSGPRAVEALAAHGVVCPEPVVVTDDVPDIAAAIRAALDGGARLVFTTGGTGVTPRDNTPEATAPFVETRLPGLEAQILNHGLTKTPLAGLSRGIVGVTGRGADAAVIVNAPGSSGGVRDAIEVIGPLMPHLLEQLGGGDH